MKDVKPDVNNNTKTSGSNKWLQLSKKKKNIKSKNAKKNYKTTENLLRKNKIFKIRTQKNKYKY